MRKVARIESQDSEGAPRDVGCASPTVPTESPLDGEASPGFWTRGLSMREAACGTPAGQTAPDRALATSEAVVTANGATGPLMVEDVVRGPCLPTRTNGTLHRAPGTFLLVIPLVARVRAEQHPMHRGGIRRRRSGHKCSASAPRAATHISSFRADSSTVPPDRLETARGPAIPRHGGPFAPVEPTFSLTPRLRGGQGTSVECDSAGSPPQHHRDMLL